MTLPTPDLLHAVLYLAWFAQSEQSDRLDGWRS